jgi:hypothetical protein
MSVIEVAVWSIVLSAIPASLVIVQRRRRAWLRASVVTFCLSFVGSLMLLPPTVDTIDRSLHDRWHARAATQCHKGLTQAEVTNILGSPTSTSDNSGTIRDIGTGEVIRRVSVGSVRWEYRAVPLYSASRIGLVFFHDGLLSSVEASDRK